NPSESLINPLTSKIYVQEFQDEKIEKKEHREDSVNLGLGVGLTVVAGIWLIYFKKRIWNSEISSSTN
ncbi:MAG: hypothetical protein OER82_12030, partial [Nitrosopumilus sp.]|nr:hypothetical protein [Nitrosopumilus sp.]